MSLPQDKHFRRQVNKLGQRLQFLYKFFYIAIFGLIN